MTLANYEQMVDWGVVDPDNAYVCYPAAFDQISPYSSVHQHTYEAYDEFCRRVHEDIGLSDFHTYRSEWADLDQRVAEDLGLFTDKNVHYGYVRCPEELERILVENCGWRIAISVCESHLVGVTPNGSPQTWSAWSTWVPFEDPEHVTVNEMMGHLSRPVRFSRTRSGKKTCKDPNVWVYPPDRRWKRR